MSSRDYEVTRFRETATETKRERQGFSGPGSLVPDYCLISMAASLRKVASHWVNLSSDFFW